MSAIKPWAVGPFEMLYHAETHFLNGEDFDRRIALISFDNAIEVSITTYLGLNPVHRGGRQYQRSDVDQWLYNYHTKLDFFYQELNSRGLAVETEKEDIIHYHDHRNDQYHSGAKGVPEIRILEGIRRASVWIFGVLFEINDIDTLLIERVEIDSMPKGKPLRDADKDARIDAFYVKTDIGGFEFYPSDILYNMDYEAYKVIADELSGEIPEESDEN